MSDKSTSVYAITLSHQQTETIVSRLKDEGFANMKKHDEDGDEEDDEDDEKDGEAYRQEVLVNSHRESRMNRDRNFDSEALAPQTGVSSVHPSVLTGSEQVRGARRDDVVRN